MQRANPKPRSQTTKARRTRRKGELRALRVSVVRMNQAHLRRALPVHDDGVERLTLAEVDKVVRHSLIGVQLDEIPEPLCGDRRLDTTVERAEVFGIAVPLFTVEIYQSSHCFDDSPGWDLRDDLSEMRSLVGDTAADEHEILRHGFASDLAHASLETEGADVMLAASIRAAADADVS